MGKYDVVIKKINPRRNHWLRYEVIIYWDKENNCGEIGWAYTLWGAHRQAKALIRKHEQKPEIETVIEEYKL